jgi:hypothetical protein
MDNPMKIDIIDSIQMAIAV